MKILKKYLDKRVGKQDFRIAQRNRILIDFFSKHVETSRVEGET